MIPSTTPVQDLPNLGPRSAGWLAEVGIRTAADLRALGPVAAYLQVKNRVSRTVSLNLLWALAGALSGTDWRQLSASDKDRLRNELAEWSQ